MAERTRLELAASGVTGFSDKHPQATTLDAFIGDDDHHNGAYGLHYATWRYGIR